MMPLVILLDYTILSQPLGILAFIARICGISGTVILLWEYILSARGIVGKFVPDVEWLVNLHKKFGKYGFLLILLHPILISIYYFNTLGVNLIRLNISNSRDVYRDLGIAALALLAVIWVTSAVIRGKMSFRFWQRLHLTSYVILPFVLIHNIGLARNVHPVNGQVYWYTMAVIYLVFLVAQILAALGIMETKYKVAQIKQENAKVITLVLEPLSKKQLRDPKAGQFIYIQFPGNPETHPFSVSGINVAQKQIAVTAKDLGQFSEKLQKLKVGDTLVLEGPYGVFGQEIYTTKRDIVLIAGGIGMTPFMPVIQDLAGGWNKPVTLFYGNQTEADVSFLPELAYTESTNHNFKIVQVITKPVNVAQETGFITCEIMQRHLDHDLENYEFFVCGPPVMITKLVPELEEFDVPKNQIHFELFSW